MARRAQNSRRTLGDKQLAALDLVVGGKPDREVAEAVGVTRQTVCEWRNHDPVFQAELNGRRRDLWAESSDRLRALVPKAVQTVEQALDSGDVRTALRIIELAGLHKQGPLGEPTLGPESFGSTDPDEVEHEAEEQQFLKLLRR